jgi:hypothetical protein
MAIDKTRIVKRIVVMGDTEYSVFDTSDTTNSGIGNATEFGCLMAIDKTRIVKRIVVMGDTEYSVFDTSDTTNSGIGIDY